MISHDAAHQRILIVNDAPVMLNILCPMLTDHGYRVYPALSGELALKFLEKNLVDLILLEILMPQIDSYELCRRLKVNERTRDIPVIFLSRHNGACDKVKAFEAGGVDYICKPFHPEEVLTRVKTHLKLCSVQQQLSQQNMRLHKEIRERHQIEQRLLHLEKAIETAQIGITISDPSGKILYSNPADATMHGYTVQELIGQSSSIFAARNSGQAQAPENFETISPNTKRIRQNRRKDASEFPVELISSPIYDAQGGYLGRVTVCEDITERQKAEQDLQCAKESAESASRAKGLFLANMSHELRTPLNSILGFTQLMINQPFHAEESLNYLQTIKNSGEHLLNLIDEVLDYSKIEARRVSLYAKSFNLYHLLDDTIKMFRLKVRHNPQVQILFERDEHVPQYICTDEVKLRQVLINLLQNAVKFTASGSISLRVSLKQVKEEQNQIHVQFELEDTGIGIGPEEIGSVFEAFGQANAGKHIHGGTGLGLAISRKFVQLMGGDISVNSRLEEGSLFTFYICCQEGSVTEESTTAEEHAAVPDDNESWTETDGPDMDRGPSDAEMREALTAFDPELLKDFEQALATADISEILSVLEQIKQKNAALESSLHKLVENFEYNTLLSLLP
ncbi:hypothetical protein CSB45_04445 [candidate division KSB3 bacterium]|uniref:histidine kinase n=1 Tax=candidate division KSB3 bacterium TaxID=2044937 RepID=A0A2G6E8Z0_9BACT|nr:MAG: hypothetical protein CSB45_04445 [candidate division KSB3 bacterium]PIE30627.1 MAG: hypothetical protein CSA57_03030 [candidate division KSB3 bacterium]